MTNEIALSLNNSNLPFNIEDKNKIYTLIEINSKIYAIKTDEVLEIIKIMELDYPNKLPSCILGVMKYKENLIGVIDLRDIFNEQRIVYNLSSKIIIIKAKENICAVICDKVLDVKKLKKEKIHLIPYQKDTDFFEGVYTSNNENIYILNIENIISEISNNPVKYEKNNDKKYIIDNENSKEILSQRKNMLSKVETELQPLKALYDRGVSFLVNDIKYYINMASVKEFFKVNNSKFIKIPSTKDFIFGLINIKGDYITVLDIRSFLNNSKSEIKEKSTIIILNSPEFKLGILADEICESMDIDFDEILQKRLQNKDDNKMLEFVKDGEIYQVLDVEKLLRDERLAVI